MLTGVLIIFNIILFFVPCSKHDFSSENLFYLRFLCMLCSIFNNKVLNRKRKNIAQNVEQMWTNVMLKVCNRNVNKKKYVKA